MRRNALILPATLLGCLAVAFGLSRAFEAETNAAVANNAPVGEVEAAPDDAGEVLEERRRAEHAAMLDSEYPAHGVVTAAQMAVRRAPERDAQVLGWLRLGGHIRARPERLVGPRCATGWYELYPRGWACAGLGLTITEDAPDGISRAADHEAPLPYRYLRVSQPQTPEYHQLPSRDDQRAAMEHGARYVEMLNRGQERRAELLREGRLANEPPRPSVVVRYLERGFYVASNGTETRSRRRFARTVRGSYVREAELEQTTGPEFAGVEFDEETTLPIAWAVRTAVPLRRIEHPDGSEVFRADRDVESWERLEIIPWLRRERIAGRDYHVVETEAGERYLRRWFVGVAQVHPPPRGVGEDEPWIHIDISEQTLVLYRGPIPIYATLASSGVDGHDTPRGEFRIRRKYVSDTMANLGPEAGDDSYRIDDVPWTQYFEGSIALHGAFWHRRFGLQQSHGCVNLAPRDARYVFQRTWPEVPEGWHGVSTDRGTGFVGSVVLVTD